MHKSAIQHFAAGLLMAIAGTSARGEPVSSRPVPSAPPSVSVEGVALQIAPANTGAGGRLSTFEYGGSGSYRLAVPFGSVRIGGGWRRVRINASGFENVKWKDLEGDYERKSVRLFFLRPGRWTWTATANLETSHRAGADHQEGLSAFGLVAAQTEVSRKLRLGGGVLALFPLDGDPLVIPVPVVEYRWSPEWALSLERGLALWYRPSGGSQSFFLHVTPEGCRYRLPMDSAHAPDGMLAHERIDSRIGWVCSLAPGVRFRGFVGTTFAQEFAVKDSDRRTVERARTDPTLTAGLEAVIAF